MKRIYVLAAALLAVSSTASAQEADLRGRWTVTFSGGSIVPSGGEFHEGGRGTVLGLPTSVDAKSSRDIFDTGFGWRGGVGYGVARKVELFGEFAWNKAEASELSVGNVASLDLRAAFGDYKSYGMDGGMRFHFVPDARVSPYVGARGGLRWVDAIPGTFSVPAAGVTLPNTPFFDDSLVPVLGGDVGVLIAATSRISFGVEAGLRYHTKLSDIEGLAGTGLENLNDAGAGWSAPISGVVQFRF